MLDSILSSAADSVSVTLSEFLICTGASIVLGLIAALICMYKAHYSQSFIISIAMMPAVVQMVIMLVNGNIGTGVAVMGAFTLVRFRSTPGSAREISSIFLAMAIGLATGMGYIWIAALFLAIMGLLNIILLTVDFGGTDKRTKQVKILIDETLDHEGVFDDIFDRYTLSHQLTKLKTKNMGSMYEMTYRVKMKDADTVKGFIDDLRTRNGNLQVSIAGHENGRDEL